MMLATIKRADEILDNNEAIFVGKSYKITSFKVKQRCGSWADVWRTEREGQIIWSCNAVDEKRKWGCVMYAGARTRPFCSHTLACELLIEKEMIKNEN